MKIVLIERKSKRKSTDSWLVVKLPEVFGRDAVPLKQARSFSSAYTCQITCVFPAFTRNAQKTCHLGGGGRTLVPEWESARKAKWRQVSRFVLQEARISQVKAQKNGRGCLEAKGKPCIPAKFLLFAVG